MARKKEERGNGSRNKNKKGQNKREKPRSGSGSEDLDIIKSQLLALGLSLRQVPGDGNCLFRALGDQLDGHMGNHYRHRKDTTNYMLEHHDDFQPFVEDDIPFDRHMSELAQFGTYAGNDAIVAFARLYQVTIVIHQPNFPVWHIKGWETTDNVAKSKKKFTTKQLHIAYHGGDHYDSVRKLGDTSHTPTDITLQIDSGVKKSSPNQLCAYKQSKFDPYENSDDEADYQEVNDVEREAIQRSGCTDLHTVRQLLDNNCGNLDAAIEELKTFSVES